MTFSKISAPKDRMPGKHFSEYAAFEMGLYDQIYWKRSFISHCKKHRIQIYSKCLNKKSVKDRCRLLAQAVELNGMEVDDAKAIMERINLGPLKIEANRWIPPRL